MPQHRSTIDDVLSLCKRRGFAYPSGEIYGGTGAWDYGPLGVALKEAIQRQWWRAMVQLREDVVGLDSSVVLPAAVWRASGHVDAYTAPVLECERCHDVAAVPELRQAAGEEGLRLDAIPCRACGAMGSWVEASPVTRLVSTRLGAGAAGGEAHYLRPELAQGAFLNFANVVTTSRRRLPFGIAQAGKAFRNELSPGAFPFRTHEFERLELAYFVEPGAAAGWHDYWVEQRREWYVRLGVDPARLRRTERPADDLAHFATRGTTLEYHYGDPEAEWGELERIADRSDDDLARHSHASGADLRYYDQRTGERYIPHVVEPVAGLTRAFMAFLVDAYAEDEAPTTRGGVEQRVVLRLHPLLAPVKVAVLPLSRHADLSPLAADLADRLRRHWMVETDDAQAIGRRYRRQDEIGTPYCVTVDFHTIGDRSVTVRDRDTMRQERVGLDALEGYLAERLVGC
ncbi:glycine--tRNA ligase [Arsenicicoccus bolidensis]|uniref:Glycine--tRNA ligase n=1 Tax=Arsenicicoccus bolidensis TaxID=229480 RepID=A0ABS9Q691_9MICO|nr:glycine--tRNA ligase [Arsenicicoccus bolidensis]MCG7323392.1 glycine--tRNA ligase [Arsenicicoccus bolidensis]